MAVSPGAVTNWAPASSLQGGTWRAAKGSPPGGDSEKKPRDKKQKPELVRGRPNEGRECLRGAVMSSPAGFGV